MGVALQDPFYILETQVKFVDHKKSNLTEHFLVKQECPCQPVADRSMSDMYLILTILMSSQISFFPKLNRQAVLRGKLVPHNKMKKMQMKFCCPLRSVCLFSQQCVNPVY